MRSEPLGRRSRMANWAMAKWAGAASEPPFFAGRVSARRRGVHRFGMPPEREDALLASR